MKYLNFLCLVLVGLLALGAYPTEAVASDACIDDFSETELLLPEQHAVQPNLALYGCKGELFLVNVETGSSLLKINES